MKTEPINPNYIESRHEYFGLPNDEGTRVRSVDVWFATKPSSPEYGIVDYKDRVIDSQVASVVTAWCVEKAGMDRVYIFDREDIKGLRFLLDRIEADFDRRDMESLQARVREVDNDDESE